MSVFILDALFKQVTDTSRIGSDYFAMCFGEHIVEEVDLVLLDMGQCLRLVSVSVLAA